MFFVRLRRPRRHALENVLSSDSVVVVVVTVMRVLESLFESYSVFLSLFSLPIIPSFTTILILSSLLLLLLLIVLFLFKLLIFESKIDPNTAQLFCFQNGEKLLK